MFRLARDRDELLPKVEENAWVDDSMGVIRKKHAVRGTDGGTKYHCDVCSVDVTSTVGGLLISAPATCLDSTNLNVIIRSGYLARIVPVMNTIFAFHVSPLENRPRTMIRVHILSQ